jgi:hypothetical protein
VTGTATDDLPAALADLRKLMTTYVEFATDEQADAVTLWIAYTHWFGSGQQEFGFVPYLLTTSAERQSGKSTLLELAAMTVHEPLVGQNISAALVGRICGARTLLLDEIDGVYTGREAGDDSGATALKTILNAGFKHDGVYQRLERGTMEPQSFSVFGPKMLVGLGRNVPDTVADRSIAIRLIKKAHQQKLPKLRERKVRPDCDGLRKRLSDLASEVPLSYVDDLPEELDGRRQDIWEPLFALAMEAGADWMDRARTASIELTKAEPNISLGVQLLADIRDLFAGRGDPEMIPTTELIGKPANHYEGTPASGLCAIEESPWATYTRGKPITPYRVSLFLREFDIQPERDTDGAHGYGPKGYWRERFVKPWERYLADTSDTSDSPTADGVIAPAAVVRSGPDGVSLGVSGVSDLSDTNLPTDNADMPVAQTFMRFQPRSSNQGTEQK